MSQSPSADVEFCGVYDRHVCAIRRYLHRRLPASKVDDATAEVFLVAWRRFERMPRGGEWHRGPRTGSPP